MILDKLSNAKTYYSISEKIEIALKYLQHKDLVNMPNGKYPIEDEIYVIIQEYESKHQDLGKWEAHEKFIDIQFIISGREKIGQTPVDGLIVNEPYNNEKDIVFFENKKDIGNFLVLEENDFAIFYPQDAHMPGLSVDKPAHVKKAVIKIPV